MSWPPVRIHGSEYKAEVLPDGSIPVTAIRGISLADSANMDAFQRVRTSEPLTLFDDQHEYNEGDIFWGESNTSGGSVTHNANESSVSLTIDTTSNASVIRQTYDYFRYAPGKSQMIMMTFVLGATNTNVTKLLGYGDGNNGLFLVQKADGSLHFRRRTKTSGSAVDNDTPQNSWNLDPMNGKGPSGIQLDYRKTQILFIDLEWLGVGRVRMGFVVDGKIYYAHELNHANILTLPYMTTANLPLRFQITATGAAGGNTTLKQICSTVISEGGAGATKALNWGTSANGLTGRTSISSQTAILSIRPKASFNSITNRGRIEITGLSVFSTSANVTMFWELVYNPTLGGTPSWNSVDAASIVEKDVAGTTITGGQVMECGFAASSAANKVPISTTFSDRRPITLDVSGANPFHVSLVVTPSSSATIQGALTWREIY